MRTISSSGRDSMIVINVRTDTSSLQVSYNGGPLTSSIFVKEAYGEGSGLAVYCSCWDEILGTWRTRTSYTCFVSSYCLSKVIGRDLGQSNGVSAYTERPEILTWSESGNGICQEQFRWKGSCIKCQKKLVKGVRIFCRIFFIGRRQ